MLPQDLDLASNTDVISTASVCDYCEWHEMTQNIDGSKLSLLTISMFAVYLENMLNCVLIYLELRKKYIYCGY